MEFGLKELKEYGAKLSLLLVEDSKTAQTVYKKILAPFFGNIDSADNGLEGLEKFKSNDYCIVITDINMPVMDGIEMARKIKEINKSIPIIIVTSFSAEENLLEAIKIGINKFIKKSADPTELLEAVIDSLLLLFRELELQKQQKIAEQQKHLASMGELITNIAHQWRQPLNYMALTIQEIKEAYGAGELTREYLDDMAKSTMSFVTQMSKTIDDFSNYFRSGNKKEKFLLNEIVLEVIKSIESCFDTKEIKIELQIEEGLTIEADRFAMNQVISNIIKNSIEAHTHNKSENMLIRVEAGHDKTQTGAHQMVVIRFFDNGGGISDGVIDRVFEPYFTTRFQSSGKGLGLYIAKMIVQEQFLGVIEVKNTNSLGALGVEVDVRF